MKHFIFIMALLTIMSPSCTDDSHLASMPPPGDLTGNERTLEDAINEVQSLITDLGWNSTRNLCTRYVVKVDTISIQKCATRDDAEQDIQTQLYLFNFQDSLGYALYSADKNGPGLVAISDNGNLDLNSCINHPGVELFLEGLETNIFKQPQVKPNDPDYDETDYWVYGEWDNNVIDPGGSCKVKWGQSSPYNLYCPKKDSKNTLTGCVPTAIAQLMSIKKHPESYQNTQFNWHGMTISKSALECDFDDMRSIATLMRRLGDPENLNVDYDTISSGAAQQNIPRTFKNFDYTSGGSLVPASDYSVLSELKLGFPILMGGYSHKAERYVLGFHTGTSYTNGHVWLGNGLLIRKRTNKRYSNEGRLRETKYVTEYYVLCNWGWNGKYDGYYLNGMFNAGNPCFNQDYYGSRSENWEGVDHSYRYHTFAITGIRK